MKAPSCKCGFPMSPAQVVDRRYGRELRLIWACDNPRGCIHPSLPREFPPAGHAA